MKIAFIVQNLAQLSDSVGYDCLYQYRIARAYYPQDGTVRLFAEAFDRSLHPDVTIEPFKDFWSYIETNPDATIVYHFCDGWERVDDYLRDQAKNVIVRWHNNTPPWFYVDSNVDFAAGCNRGFRIISRMAYGSRIRFMVNSEFTRRQLCALGAQDALIDTVFPASNFLKKPGQDMQPAQSREGLSSSIDLLFVGRVVPHKGHRHILSTAAAVQRFTNRPVRAIFAGALEDRLSDYWTGLSEIATRLGVQLAMPGLVSEAELTHLYHHCDAFICMSEHEGFGMPVFEAMRCRLPVIAWSTSAMADLLVDHPLASRDFDIPHFAACILAALEPTIRQSVLAVQDRVLLSYTDVSVTMQFTAALARLAGSTGAEGESDTPDIGVPSKTKEQIATFVNALADWIGQDVGDTIETFVHDAPTNYVSLYDVDVHDRLIDYIRSGGVINGSAEAQPSRRLDDLHPSHAIVRHIMAGGGAAELPPLRDLHELLRFDDEVFVRLAFRSALGRAADRGGMAAYLARRRGGETKLSILREMLFSDEGRAFDSPLIGQVAATVPEDEARLLAAAVSKVDRIRHFLLPNDTAASASHPMGSIHHVNDLLWLGDAAFIQTAYLMLLGRAADPEGLAFYKNAIRHGKSRHQFLNELAATSEGQERLEHLEGLQTYLAGPDDLHRFLANPDVLARLALLDNELGRVTNQLVLKGDGTTDDHGERAPKSLLRLASKAVEEGVSFEAMRARAIDSYAFEQARSASGTTIMAQARPGSGEVAFSHLHQILITESGEVPDSFAPVVEMNVKSLRDLHPEAEYRLWGAEDLRRFIVGHFDREVVEAFDHLQAFALKADLARYCLLYIYGGLYSDLSNRFLSRWRLPESKTLACFREHKPLHGALWMNQNTMIYAAPGQPEIKLAIDLVVENVRMKEYGVSSLAPSGPVLFGRVFAAFGRVDRYHIGEAINLQVDGGLNRANYVNPNGEIVAVRLQGGGGKPSEIGLKGTNVYGEMWERREIYGEGMLLFARDDARIVTTVPRAVDGVHLDGPNAQLKLPGVSLPRGLYTATWQFAKQEKPQNVDLTVCLADGYKLGEHRMRPDETGDVVVSFSMQQAGEIDLDLMPSRGFSGIFKQAIVRRVSPDPSDLPNLPAPRSTALAVDARARADIAVTLLHHIAYNEDHFDQGDAEIVSENLRIASQVHHGAKAMFWTDGSLRDFIASRFNADVVAAFDRLSSPLNRSEFGRYCLLYALGGLYVDPWVRLVNPIGVPADATLGCFRAADIEESASWSIDTDLLYAVPEQAELHQLIDQITQTCMSGDYGMLPGSMTGGERLGRVLAVNYDARHYFGGEVISLTRGYTVSNDCFLSQDGRLVAVRKGPDSPATRALRQQRELWVHRMAYRDA
ncbi:glycosyltransferase [Sphingobium limneticum]|uniref:glycosyltransferase n=1 Tax=Sphingobium TaxID=165695 RepID=UPI00313827FE